MIEHSIKVLLSLVFLGITGIARSEVLTARADMWCPYNCLPEDGERQGILVDLLRETFSKKGYTVDYGLLPWTQAVADVRTGIFHAVIGVARDDSVGLLHTVEPQVMSLTCIYGQQKSTKTVVKAQDLLTFTSLGVAKDYSYGEKTDLVLRSPAMKSVVKPIGGETPLKTNIRKLLGGTVEALVEDGTVMDYEIDRQDLVGIKKLGCTEDQAQLWIGFSPRHPKSKEWVELLSSGEAALRESGTLKKIYAKYGLSETRRHP